MSVFLDVTIGLFFLYLLLALVVTTVQELLAGVLSWRARNLYDALEHILVGTVPDPNAGPQGSGAPGTGLVNAFYSHPLIQNLMRTPWSLPNRKLSWKEKSRLPSYIPSKTFVLALLDVMKGTKNASEAVGSRKLFAQAHTFVDRLSDDGLKRTLLTWVKEAEDSTLDLDKKVHLIGQGIESWFNDRMARASGWYKRKAQYWALGLSFVVTVSFNADTLHVADRLWKDATLRSVVVTSAQAYHAAQSPPSESQPPSNPATPSAQNRNDTTPAPTGKTPAATLAERTREIASVGFPIGWASVGKGTSSDPHRQSFGGWSWLRVLLGWLVTALAVSLGANFWFDLLGKAFQIRGSGPRVSAATGELESKKK